MFAARTLHFAACVSLVGGFAFECLIGGALRRGRSGTLAPRLSVLYWTSLALALVSGVGWLAGVAVAMSGEPLRQALSPRTLGIVLTQTRIGDDWQLRFGLAVLLGALLWWRRRQCTAAAAWLALIIATLLLVTLAWAGHGASDVGTDGVIHLVADLLHLLAAGLWLGGLVPFALLLAMVRADDPNAIAVARTATHRFSLVAMVSVAVLLGSGGVNTWYLSGSVPALLGTDYGRLLLLKIGLFLVMLVVAAVNRLRLTPELDGATPADAPARLRRNATVETILGLGVLAIVGAIGIMTPGSHTEPVWPLPFRIDPSALSTGGTIVLLAFATLLGLSAVTMVAALAAGCKRLAGAAVVGLIVAIAFGGAPLGPALVQAYPTTYFAPTVPYDAAEVMRGATIYAQNCVACHGVSGRGDGPLAARLPIKPADLVQAHLFAHTVGDLYWWIGHGLGGVMPPFDRTLSPTDRWNVIHFIRAHASAVLATEIGPQVTGVATAQLPDFAFESGGLQDTMGRVVAEGPALLVLFDNDVPAARLQQLAAAQLKLIASGLAVIAVDVDAIANAPANAPYVVGIAPDVAAALRMFRAPNDGGETELLLDANGVVRARWTAGDLAPPATLADDARRVAQFSAAAPNHAGHGG